MFSKLGLLWRTVRHLKPVQFYGRLWFRYYEPKIDTAPAPKSSEFKGLSTRPARRDASMVRPFAWRFLNEEGTLDDLGWQDGRRSKLWRYNQHYFDDLNAIDASDRTEWHKDLIERWIAENPPADGNGWEPYPTSLRIVNWVKWASSGNELSPDAITSLAIQTRWLSRRLEWHLLGNHLFANAKALIFAGLFFDGDKGQGWLSKGMQILEKQVPEQILEDGGQFELTPMYHALALEDFLDLINICRANSSQLSPSQSAQVLSWIETIPRILTWLSAVSHPDGKISFFNDAAFGVAPENSELFAYAKRLDFETPRITSAIIDLEKSGFVRMQSERAVVIADIAEIGPSYLPGHAHADTLSFELSVDGQRIFVNSGTSEYGLSSERLRQRGTPAHNTVCVNGRNSSEVWSGFRVGSRAQIIRREVGCNGKRVFASGCHHGYARENNGLTHSRKFSLDETNLCVSDELSRPAIAEARYHLNPDVTPVLNGADFGELHVSNDQVLRWSVEGASQVELEDSTWHPEFGILIPNKCIVAKFEGQYCKMRIDWG